MSNERTGVAPVTKVGWVEMSTSDTDAMVDHYVRVLGLDVVEQTGSTSYLGLNSDHHCLVIRSGEPTGRSALGLQLAGELDLAESRLREAGVEVERRTDPSPGVGVALVVSEPRTDIPVVLYESMRQTHAATTLGPRPTKLGHVASFAPDLPTAQAFFCDLLGFRWSDTVGDFFTFLRCNADHHAVNIMSSDKRTGLHHVAFEARDMSHLKDMLDRFARHQVRLTWGPGRHGPGHNVFSYHEDPDGNLVEAYTEIDVVLDEREPRWEPRPWHEEFPMGPKHWPLEPSTANQWGPMDPTQVAH